MSDDAGTQADADAQAAAAAADDQPQVGNDGAAQAAAAVDSPGELARARAEAAKYRKELREIQAKLKERDDADLSTTQKLEREKTALEAEKSQLEARLRDANVQAIAAKVGVKADLADTVSSLIDWDEVDADDQKAIEKAVKELVKERPSLSARPAGLEGGRRTRQDGEGDMDSVIRRAAGRA